MSPAEGGLVRDGDPAARAECSPGPQPRWSRLAIAFALIIVGAVVGILGSVPGSVNGATLLGVGMTVGAIVIVIKEIARV